MSPLTTIAVEDPELVEKKTIDPEGRVTIGKNLAGLEARIVVELLEEP